MSTQKTGSIKVPQFDRANYNLWKRKMLLFIKASNPLYIGILENGPFIPMKAATETTSSSGDRVSQGATPKTPTEFTDADKELVRLDTGLMLIITDSMDNDMNYQIMNCISGKHMWDTVETLMEGTEEVRENRLDILTSQYVAFKSFPGENVTRVLERFTRLLNELRMQGKTYPLRETNRKFMLTMPSHVGEKLSSIRERDDFSTMTLERIYGKLRTHEMELEQRMIIYGPGSVSNKNTALAKTTALVVNEAPVPEERGVALRAEKEEIIEAELASVNLNADESEYYTLEELEQMEDKSMAYLAGKFSHIRFKRNPRYKFKGTANRFQKGSYSSGSSSRGGSRSNFIDRSKARCYNCNELGHFASECKKPKQQRKETYDRKDSVEGLKKENARLKQELEAMTTKHKGRAYIAEGRSWDDTDSDEEEYGNLAMMADSSEESPDSSQVPILTTLDLSLAEYKSTVHDLSVEMFNVHTSLLASETENAKLVQNVKTLEAKNEELGLVSVSIEDLKQKNEYLENKVKVNVEIEAILREKISMLELKLNAIYNSANVSEEIIKGQMINQSTAIRFDYSKKMGKRQMNFTETPVSDKVEVPSVLHNVEVPIYQKPVSDPITEETLIIRLEIFEEDMEKKKEKKIELPKGSVKFVKSENQTGSSGLKKVKNNRNGKVKDLTHS